MWFDKNLYPIFSTSFQVMLSLSLCLFLLDFLPISISSCQSVAHLFHAVTGLSETLCHRFQFFFQHLHINLRPSCLPSWGAGNGEKVAKEWLRCQFINTAHRETAWMKAPMPLENYPPSRGQVICYTVEHHNKHQHIHIQSEGYKLELGK